MKKKTLALILTLCMTFTGVVCFTAGAAAAGGLQEIKAYLNSDITIKLDGEAKVLTDASGVRTYPISYNGTTYLPIRSIGNLLGVKVDWDQATKSVLLGKPGAIDLIDSIKAYDFSSNVAGVNFDAVQVQSSEKQTQEISGVSCSHWVRFWLRRYNEQGSFCSASFNVEGKYENVTFQYYADNDVTLQVLGDNGAVLFEKAITGGQVAQTATVPLFKTTQLTFQIEKPNGEWKDITAYIFNAKLDAEK